MYTLECIETRKEKVSFHFQASTSGHGDRHAGMDFVRVSFGQDVHWSNCRSVMVSLWGFEGMICKSGAHSRVLCSNFLSLLAEVCRIYVS